jgi:hypothetical protein
VLSAEPQLAPPPITLLSTLHLLSILDCMGGTGWQSDQRKFLGCVWVAVELAVEHVESLAACGLHPIDIDAFPSESSITWGNIKSREVAALLPSLLHQIKPRNKRFQSATQSSTFGRQPARTGGF